MWSILNGTIVNALAVAIGSAVGLAASARLPDRYRVIVLSALGLITITLGIDAAMLGFADTVGEYASLVPPSQTYGARLALVTIGSLIIGAIMGTALRIHERVESLGALIHRHFVY